MPFHSTSRLLFAVCVTAFSAVPTIARALDNTVPSERYALPAPAAAVLVQAAGIDRARELAADAQIGSPHLAPRYAVKNNVTGVALRHGESHGGEWRNLADGMALWRIPIRAANALSLDFGFRRFFLPPGAQLFVHAGTETRGPYTEADNPRSREFWTPLVHGGSAQIELLVPQTQRAFVDLELSMVHAGYRDIFAPASLQNSAGGSGICNIDTICPQGDAWRAEINAVAALTADAHYCTGQLLNNTRGDRAPLLATAAHCWSTADAGGGLVAYWKYESPTCRAVGTSDNAQPIPTSLAIAQTGGAALVATDPDSDVTLFRLNTAPPASANVYFTGWDRSDQPFDSAVVLHHPQSDVKRISFGIGITSTDDAGVGQGLHHWRVDHYTAGTTEGGSSGAGLLDSNHHLRGVLSNGVAACNNASGDDYYGRLGTAWQGGGTPSSRLSDWLDPDATGATRVDGVTSCNLANVALALSADTILAGDKLTLTASVSGGVAPYTYGFDVDGDGVSDNADPTQPSLPAVYPREYVGNVSVTVTDANGCIGTASKALIVQAPHITPAALPLATTQALCGASTDTSVLPGQRLRTAIALTNNGTAASQAGYAVFAQDPATLSQSKLTLETPAVALPALAPGQSTVVNLDYALDAGNSCGAPVKIDLIGSADARGFSAVSGAVVDTAIATNCQAVTTCAARTMPLQLDAGAYYDPLRPGNGMTLVTQPGSGADLSFFGLWFTGDAQREPTWYQVQALLHANQVNSPLYLAQQSIPLTWPAHLRIVGSAQVTLVEPDKFVFSWSLDGVAGGALYSPVTGIPSTIRLWYNPTESGWGLYDQLAQIQATPAPPLIATLAYLYDSNGVPRWIQGNNSSYVAGATLDAVALRPSCPSCVWLDAKSGQQSIGTLSYSGSGSNVQISTNLVFPAAMPGTWTRQQLLLTPLYQSP